MAGLQETIRRLKAMSKQAAGTIADREAHLQPLSDFGTNPGQLGGWVHVPAGLERGAPLVVVLHGCTQDANGYDRGAGWSKAADRHGFAVLFPEQRRSNNSNLCFNWFNPDDITRGRGETMSIRQMVTFMVDRHRLERERVFVTGLSAGGAMTAVMLATYPEVFAGGAVIAGLPYGTARSVQEALERMRHQRHVPPDTLAGLVRAASSHQGPWPTLSVWHGTRDATVDRSNAEALIDQWRGLHRVGSAPQRTDKVQGYPHQVWLDRQGRAVLERYAMTGLGHGTPLSAASSDGREIAGPHMLEAGISSTEHILSFWGVAGGAASAARPTEPTGEVCRTDGASEPRDAILERSGANHAPSSATSVQKTIEDALRSAGLLPE